MTPAEFMAWFEGMCENIQDVPTAVQWDKIKKRLSSMDHVVEYKYTFTNRPAQPRQPAYWGVGEVGDLKWMADDHERVFSPTYQEKDDESLFDSVQQDITNDRMAAMHRHNLNTLRVLGRNDGMEK